jgi:hypothetical protein
LGQKAILDKVDSSTIAKTIIVGSLVKANGIYLYLSAALPKIAVDGINVIASSITIGAVNGKPRRIYLRLMVQSIVIQSIQ